jgi:hypothetical protein
MQLGCGGPGGIRTPNDQRSTDYESVAIPFGYRPVIS